MNVPLRRCYTVQYFVELVSQRRRETNRMKHCTLQPLQKVELGSTNATISTDFPECVVRQVARKPAQCNSAFSYVVYLLFAFFADYVLNVYNQR